jgi:hypothetical protein
MPTAQPSSAPIKQVEQWRVFLSLDPAEADAIQQAASSVIRPERFAVGTELLEGGADGDDVTMWLVVSGESEREALDEVARLYQRVREAALLSDQPARVLGFIGPPQPSAPSRDEHLMTEASDLLAENRPEMAVVAMQVACELLAAQVLESLFTLAGLSKQSVRRPPSLQDIPTRAILFLITGERIEEQPWWRDYVAHLERRKSVVHDGLTVPPEQAEASWKAALAFREYVRGLVSADEGGAEARASRGELSEPKRGGSTT